MSIAVLTACNSDSIMEISTIEKPITKTVVVDFNAMLSFATEDDMYAEINKLKNMNCDELSAWRSSHADFISQFDFMNAVVDELDAAQSIEEVRIINEVSPNFYETADVASGTYIQLVSGMQNMQYDNGLTGVAKIVVGGYSRGVGTENLRITGLACVAKKKVIIVDTRGEEIEQIVDDGEEILPIDQSELENYL